MNNQEIIKEFVVKKFDEVCPKCNIEKSLVLKKREDNFITFPKSGFGYHRWAGSLKSSQAFAYNVFSGVNNPTLEFEFPMEVFDNPAQVDVKIENTKNQTIELFEVKMFEIVKIEDIKFKKKYYTEIEYKCSDIAKPFIKFISNVIENFEGQKIYGGGIKQLCSHLLGILNTMDKPDYKDKKFELYSFCFDNPFIPKFETDLKNYKKALMKFKPLVDEFLKSIKVDSRVEYCGFLSASEYVKKNERLLGKENYDYVMKRYF